MSGLVIRGLTKTLAGRPVLAGLDLTVARGEVVALLGPSGAGKTTLFRCVARLVEPEAGTVRLDGAALSALSGQELVAARRRIGLVFQQFNLVRRLSAIDNVLAARLAAVPVWRAVLRRFPAADRRDALAALDRVGLLDHAYARADRLSGGQQQRVAIARALMQDPALILADEPVASLDPETAAGVLALLRDVAAERNAACLVSLHQVDLALRFADRVVGLKDGRIAFDLPPRAIGRDLLRDLFGAGPEMLAAVGD